MLCASPSVFVHMLILVMSMSRESDLSGFSGLSGLLRKSPGTFETGAKLSYVVKYMCLFDILSIELKTVLSLFIGTRF